MGQGTMQGNTKKSMSIKAGTLKYNNTWLEHQNNLQKSKTQITLGQLASTPIHLQTKKQGAAHTSMKEH